MTGDLSTTELLDFLKIEPARLQVWLERGVFGEERRSVGRGVRRRFALGDAVLARALKEILDLTRSRTLDLGSELTMALRGATWIKSGSPLLPDGRPIDRLVVMALGEEGAYEISAIGKGDRIEESSVRACIVVPLGRIIEETRRYFRRQGAA